MHPTPEFMQWIGLANFAMTVALAFIVLPMRRLRDETKAQAEQIVELKLGAIRERVGSIDARLVAGDAHLKRLDERDHTLEVKVLEAISELKDIVATKDDLQRMREEFRRA